MLNSDNAYLNNLKVPNQTLTLSLPFRNFVFRSCAFYHLLASRRFPESFTPLGHFYFAPIRFFPQSQGFLLEF